MNRKLDIIRYNVGGTVYDVPADVIATHPYSMLARIASKEWEQEPTGDDDDNEISDSPTFFINGNGNRFRYVIDYLAHGRVQLPEGVSKDAVLDDLEYYGIDFDEDNVFEDALIALTVIEDLEESAAELEVAAAGRYFELMAYACFRGQTRVKPEDVRFCSSLFCPWWNLEDSYCDSFPGGSHFQACRRLLSVHEDLFEERLARYGLRCTNLSTIFHEESPNLADSRPMLIPKVVPRDFPRAHFARPFLRSDGSPARDE